MTPLESADLDSRIETIVRRSLQRVQNDPWLCRRDAAALEGISLSKWDRRDRAGEGPTGHGSGRLRRWKRSVVNSFIENRK